MRFFSPFPPTCSLSSPLSPPSFSPPGELANVVLNLNYDMIGSPNAFNGVYNGAEAEIEEIREVRGREREGEGGRGNGNENKKRETRGMIRLSNALMYISKKKNQACGIIQGVYEKFFNEEGSFSPLSLSLFSLPSFWSLFFKKTIHFFFRNSFWTHPIYWEV